MFADDDDEEDTSITVVRYQCMPSLVALQQMRNRLHLAQTGKKLMKWTSMATSRELRVLAMEICTKYDSFREDVRNCFMLLARVRYFNTQLNGMVSQSVTDQATVTVTSNVRSVSGVRVTYFTILEKNIDPYAHLGLDKGGTTITEAKRAWRDILKRMITMASLRASFVQVEVANKNAIKKQHVLEKVVMPRTKATMAYILDQMDEMRREEFYRIKKILANKKKQRQAKLQLQKNLCSHNRVHESCPICRSSELEKKQEVPVKQPEPIKEPEPTEEPETLEELDLIEEPEPVLDNNNPIQQTENEVICVCDKLIDELTELNMRLSGIVEKAEESLTSTDISTDLLSCICDKVFEEEAEDTARADIFDATQNIQESKEKPRVDKKVSSIAITKSVLNTDHRYLRGAVTEDLELGTFEIEIIETTKIIRVKNEDGTVSEQKRVIKKKVERRNPLQSDGNMEGVPSGTMSGTFMEDMDIDETFTEDMGIDEIYAKVSNKSSKASGKVRINDDAKRIGVALVKPGVIYNLRKVESSNLPSSSIMADPIIKRCLSTSSIYSNIYYCMSRDSITSVIENKQYGLSKLYNKDGLILENEILDTLNRRKRRPDTNLNENKYSLTNSDINLLQEPSNCNKAGTKAISLSSNDFKEKMKRKKITRSMSFNLEVNKYRLLDSDTTSSSDCSSNFSNFQLFSTANSNTTIT